MKYLFLFLFNLLLFSTYGQKTFVVYNLTANTVIIDDIVTRNGTALPQFNSKPFGPISVPAFGSFTLVNNSNATRFPFLSNPASTPQITQWERTTATAPTSLIIQSSPAWLQGATQVFYRVQVRIGSNTKNIGVVGSGFPLSSTSNGWTASYTQGGTVAAPIYTITVQ